MDHAAAPADDTAASRLAALHAYYRTHPVTGPTERAAPSVTPAAPVNLAVVDHIRRSVTEIADHTRSVTPDAGPIPQRIADVYDWCRQHTAHAPETVQQRTQTIEYQHRLEHALAAGDDSVIPPHRCPSCDTVGLQWSTGQQRAVCLNWYCVQENGGTSRTWTVARLAHEHIAAQKLMQRRAT